MEVSIAGVPPGLWLRVEVGLGLGFRPRGGFVFGLGLEAADGLRWWQLDWFQLRGGFGFGLEVAGSL